MAKIPRMINRTIQLLPINRRINAIYETGKGRVETPVLGMAQVIYNDGSSGFEFIGGRVDETVDFISQGKGFKGTRDLDYKEYINQRLGVPPCESVLGEREKPWNPNDFKK